jgi:DNA recombination protein RmuC
LGRELYKRMTAMAEHIQGCGGSLAKAVKGFNDFIGSLEHSVMPQVRRFNELEVEGTAAPIPVLTHIDTEPRLLRADRDFAGQLGVSANSNTDAERRPAA